MKNSLRKVIGISAVASVLLFSAACGEPAPADGDWDDDGYSEFEGDDDDDDDEDGSVFGNKKKSKVKIGKKRK